MHGTRLGPPCIPRQTVSGLPTPGKQAVERLPRQGTKPGVMSPTGFP